MHQPLCRCVVRGSTYVPACACVHVAAVAGLLWLRLALAYQNEGDDCSCSSAVTNSMRTCAAASIACRCLDASLAHYSSYNKRTASSSSSSSSSSTVPLGGSLPAALITARCVFARHAPQGHAGDTYALPAGVGVWSPFEQQWLGGGSSGRSGSAQGEGGGMGGMGGGGGRMWLTCGCRATISLTRATREVQGSGAASSRCPRDFERVS